MVIVGVLAIVLGITLLVNGMRLKEKMQAA
jgi:hypothetical protein